MSAPVGEVGFVACVGFLVGGTGTCVLVGWAGSCPSGGQGHIQWCVLGVFELSVTLGSLSANVWVSVSVLLVVCHGASCTRACWVWVELGLSVETVISGRALVD